MNYTTFSPAQKTPFFPHVFTLFDPTKRGISTLKTRLVVPFAQVCAKRFFGVGNAPERLALFCFSQDGKKSAAFRQVLKKAVNPPYEIFIERIFS